MKARIQFVNNENEKGGSFVVRDDNGETVILSAENGVVDITVESGNIVLALPADKEKQSDFLSKFFPSK